MSKVCQLKQITKQKIARNVISEKYKTIKEFSFCTCIIIIKKSLENNTITIIFLFCLTL